MTSDHVAWLRYTRTTIQLCDSDAPGAFKVYRQRQEVERLRALLEEVRALWPDIRQLQDGFMDSDPKGFTEWDHSVRDRCIAMSFKLNAPHPEPHTQRTNSE